MLTNVVITRALAVAVAVAGAAVGLASPAWADDRLDGSFTFVDGPTSNTWSITTFCNPEGTCAGTVSSSTGMLAQIHRPPDGPWTIERHDVSNGWVCPDGSSGAADLVYSFDPASLAGTLSSTSKPGACNDPNPLQASRPINLQKVDDGFGLPGLGF